MAMGKEIYDENWWAEGDAPVRTGSRVTYFVDGHAVMLEMCRQFLKARSYIYLANWGITPQMELVRGQDHNSDPQTLTETLRAEGLQEADIQFWLSQPLSLQNVLGYAVRKGVEVKALLWKSSSLFSHYTPEEAYQQLSEVGVTCILDDSSQGILHHPIESLHQKTTIVDGHTAFVGGVDPLIEKKGEFDRWDTPEHAFNTPLRRTEAGTTPHPWHDAHALIEGVAAGDVETNFRQRWNDMVTRHHKDETLLIPQRPLPSPTDGQRFVQVVRTIPEHTYNFDPHIVQGIAQHYQHALHNIRNFAYIENQYLWLRAYYGVDLPFMGNDSPEMELNLSELGAALRRGALISIILPDHPNVGRAFSDAALQRLRDEAPQAMDEGRLQAYCLATSTQINGEEHYRPIYVHAKVAIIDDHWSTVGSGNLNNRGMRDDTEMNVSTLDQQLAHSMRLMLQAEHLGLLHADELFSLSRLLGGRIHIETERSEALNTLKNLEEKIGDPIIAAKMMHERAWENLQRYKAKQPLVGHLLPYLTAEEATKQGLQFREEHGWIEEPGD